MSDKLYRIEPCDPPCVHGNEGQHMSLVPVEPDYEAAHKELDACVAVLRRKAVLHPDDYKQMMRLFAKAIVDAALGGGE